MWKIYCNYVIYQALFFWVKWEVELTSRLIFWVMNWPTVTCWIGVRIYPIKGVTIHMKLYAQVFFKRFKLIKTDNFFWSDWWKYSDITQQSHDMVQPAAVVIVGTPSTRVAGCVQCSWSQVSLLSCYSWRPSGMLMCLDTFRDTYCIVTSVSRYESYRGAPISLHPYILYSFVDDCGHHIMNLDENSPKLIIFGAGMILMFLHVAASSGLCLGMNEWGTNVVLPIDIENPYRLSNCLYR